jgi:hypothetical protein
MSMPSTSRRQARASAAPQLLIAGLLAAALAGAMPSAQAQAQAAGTSTGGASTPTAVPPIKQSAKPSAPKPAQSTFTSPEAALAALVAALRADDTRAVAAVLGQGAGRVLRSGDAHADKQNRSDFLAAYDQSARLKRDGDQRAVLHIGAADWPLPFPIVKTGSRWRFDTQAGLRHYLDRQVGANELGVLAVLDAYVQAQREYVLKDRDRNGLLEYAQRMVSSTGQRDGLYWPSAAGEPPSPMGARFALASLGKYRGTDEAPQPFNGYFFRPLTAQGPDAAGGAYDYIVNGRQIGGFALIATPARHGVSGVMSFIVNHDGVVFSRNLGRDTSAIAARISRFNPGPGWQREPAP